MAEQTVLLHNPRCSKSREALKLLEKSSQVFQVREYLKEPLSRKELEVLAKKLEKSPREFMRKKEPAYTELHLESASDEALFKAIEKHPILLERPILVTAKKAVIGRPPEAIQSLFASRSTPQ